MKRFFGLLACLMVISFILAGCGNSTATTPPATIPSSTSPVTTAPASTTAEAPTTAVTPGATTPQSTTPAPATTSALTPKYGGTFTYVSDSAPSGTIGYPPEILVASTESPQLCMEGLLRQDNKGMMHPWLATSYKFADDSMSITFTLRQGVKFQDGSDFNAQVAKWNLDNTIAAKTQPSWKSVDVIDNNTIRVNLNYWDNTVIGSFGDGSASWMISKEAFDKNGLDWVRQHPVGTGPFKFVSFSRDVGFKTVKNPDYWGKDAQGNQLPYLDGVNILYVTDQTSQEAVMQSGGADAITIPLGKMTADMKSFGLNVFSDPVTIVSLIPDTANADSPWSKLEVREAVEYAIDKESIAKGLGYGYWQAPYQIVPRAYSPYDPNFPIVRKYDPAKAKQLLAQAGYSSGFKTTLISNPLNGSDAKNAVVAIQSYLAAVGIDATLDFPEFSKYQPSYLLGSWNNAALVQVLPGMSNYNSLLSLYFNPKSQFFKSWERTPEFVNLFNASMTSPEPDVNLIRAVVQEIAKEASAIPVWETGKNWAIEPYVMNGGFGERGLTPYWKPEQLWLNK